MLGKTTERKQKTSGRARRRICRTQKKQQKENNYKERSRMNIQRGDVTEPSEDEMLDMWKVGKSS